MNIDYKQLNIIDLKRMESKDKRDKIHKKDLDNTDNTRRKETCKQYRHLN